jgi:hypothetical protein
MITLDGGVCRSGAPFFLEHHSELTVSCIISVLCAKLAYFMDL